MSISDQAPGSPVATLAKITTTDATATPGKRKATTQLKPELPRKANASLCKTNDLNATCDLNATFTKLDKDSNDRDSNDFGSESYYVDKTPTSPASSMATSAMDVSHGTYAGKFQPGPNAVGTDEQLIALATAQDAVLADTNDLRKARDLDDLQKQKQALFGLPNQSIVPPRDDDLPSNTVDITLAHVNKMISAKTIPRQLNQFGQTFSKAAASKERGLPVQFKIKITDLDEQSRTFLGTSSQSVPVCIILDYNISYKFSTATGVDIGKHMSGFWLEQAFAPDKATPQAKLVEPGWVWFPGSTDKGLQHTWDQMKKMMATPKFSSAATPKFRGDFVVEKVSQEDAAFILAWLSDPSASKRAHSTVDLTADGLDFGAKAR